MRIIVRIGMTGKSIGRNMTVYEYGKDMILVDCGMGFPDDSMYGVDMVMPDVSWLVKNRGRLRGIFLTHGHEDHIGALPYVLEKIFWMNMKPGAIAEVFGNHIPNIGFS